MAKMMKAPEPHEIWEFMLDLFVTLMAGLIAGGIFIKPDTFIGDQIFSLIIVIGILALAWKIMRVLVTFKRQPQ